MNDVFAPSPRFVLLDGAMSTELEKRGVDTATRLWGSDALQTRPDAVVGVHRDYLAAGSRVVTTNSYQASLPTLVAAGVPRERAVEMLRTSGRLARQCVDEWNAEHPDDPAQVAGSVGPYGAHLADGSEYTGKYQLDAVGYADFHRDRIALLLDEGVDVLAIETQPRLDEVQAVLELLSREFPDARAWVSFSLAAPDQLPDRTPLAEAAAAVSASSQVIAVGVNCIPTGWVTPALDVLGSSTDKPLSVYPNSGEVFDPTTKTWSPGDPADSIEHLLPDWLDHGATRVGGCCRTTPGTISEMQTVLADA